MTDKLSGISNENEFYSNHYLSTGIDNDLKDLVADWRKEPGPTPYERLEALSSAWIQAANDYRPVKDDARRTLMSREFAHKVLGALGYTAGAIQVDDSEGKLVPLLARVADAAGNDVIWVVEALAANDEDFSSDPLITLFNCAQFPDEVAVANRRKGAIDQAISKYVFGLDVPPRFVLIWSMSSLLLIDRNRWAQRSVLRFDLQEIFTKKNPDTFKIVAALLHQTSMCPLSGKPLVDQIAEESIRHANAVSSSLKATMRDAIEILGNEVLALTGGRFKGKPIDDKALTVECLRHMYRLLFLLFIEARQDLGFAPMKSEAYRKGYSLDALRELELVPLRTKEDREGTMLSASLDRLLFLMFNGTPGGEISTPTEVGDEVEYRRDFSLQAVKVELLDPDSTPIISSLKLRNAAVQQIIRLMSLSSGKGNSRAGRISYSQLGISQLGAVYETLLSFTGFIAREDLIEVKPGKGVKLESDDAGEDLEAVDEDEDIGEPNDTEIEGRVDKLDLLGPAWFVPASRSSDFEPDEIVYDGPRARIYPKGSFIYRLAGRDRQNSASYYTPEPLARLLVKHALLDLCKDMKSDEILKLRVCEPAMGSAAFLVETTNQLADLYLERKQAELGRVIPQDDYGTERQKVRAYIADRNCFGVDLNPVAVELGQISMWLNCLHSNGSAPWFGDQLHAGNSLFGARRAAYPVRMLTGKAKDLWLNQNPIEIGWRGYRQSDQVWQFLLPADGMADFHTNKAIKAVAAAEQQAIKNWRKDGFFSALDADEIKLVRHLSKVCDQLFDEVADAWEKEREATNEHIPIWPEGAKKRGQAMDYRQKRELLRAFQNETAGNSLPYKRLKTAMDAWCALWCWPLDKVDELPDRSEFLFGLSMVLEGGMTDSGEVFTPSHSQLGPRQGEMFNTVLEAANGGDSLFEVKEVPAFKQARLFHEVNVDTLVSQTPWLQTAGEVASRLRFAHFDLLFADVLRERGGFDLMIGNPPWLKPTWNDTLILGDMDPTFIVRGYSAKETEDAKEKFLADSSRRKPYLDAFVATSGAINASASGQMMPYVGAGQNNLYKCFIDLTFRLTAPKGRAALIHQDGHLVDPKAGIFRSHWYSRARKHFEFSNRIKGKLFSEVDHNLKFSLNVYRGNAAEIDFDHISNAFLASQVDACYAHDGTGPIPGIKGDDEKWDTRGHGKRLVRIRRSELQAIHAVLEEDTVPELETRFVQPYSVDTLKVLKAFADASGFATGAGEFRMDPLWHESGSQKEGLIVRDTQFRTDLSEMVLTGPMFHIGNPLYKSAKRISRTSNDYEVIDLHVIDEDYLPRTNYGRASSVEQYHAKFGLCPWDKTKTHVDFYRVAFRNMINLNSERSLIGAMIPPGVAHVHTVESVAYSDTKRLIASYPAWISLPFDYLTKATSKSHFSVADIETFPWLDVSSTAQHRALRLAAVSRAYADIWNEHASTLDVLPWSSSDVRLNVDGNANAAGVWAPSSAFRTEFARRLALVEIDVLVSMALGLTVEQLVDIYRLHFPVLQKYENATWYDQNGRIVWTASRGLLGVGYLDARGKSPSQANWESDFADMKSGTLSCQATIDFLPGGPQAVERTFVAPFTKCDRAADYRRAWKHFEGMGVPVKKVA